MHGKHTDSLNELTRLFVHCSNIIASHTVTPKSHVDPAHQEEGHHHGDKAVPLGRNLQANALLRVILNDNQNHHDEDVEQTPGKHL